MYEEDNDYSDSDESEIHCHMIKILKVTESDDEECEVCGENIQGGHYKCYTHAYSMCAKCYFDQQYSSSDSDSDSDSNSEIESEDKSGNKAISSQEIQTSKNTNKMLLQNIPCKVMNPLRKTFEKETASDIKNENVPQNLNIQIPPPSNNSRSLFLSENSKLKDAEIYTYPPQMSLSTDMCVAWEDLAIYDLGKKTQAAKVANNNWGSTNGQYKILNSMFKKQIFLSFFYQSFRDARIEFDEHNKSCNGPEKLSNEKTEIEKEEIVSCLQSKDKKTDEEVLEDYDSDIIDLKKVGGGSTFNDNESQSKMKDTEKQGKEEKGEKLSKVDLSRFSLNINIILFDGIDDYLQATYIDPSLLATTIRYHHVLETISYFQQNSSTGLDYNPYNNFGSGNSSKDKKKSNYLDGAYLYSKSVSKEGLKKYPRMTALLEKDPSDNGSSFNNSASLISQPSVTLLSLTKALKVGGNIQYGTVRKQQMVTNPNTFANSTIISSIKNDVGNFSPSISKWVPKFKPPQVFGSSPSQQSPTSSPLGSGFNFGNTTPAFNPNPFGNTPLTTPPPPSFSFGGGTGFGGGKDFGGSLVNKEPSDLSGKKASVVTKKMLFEDQYRLSPVTKFLGYIKISGGIYPMYNFHQCFDSKNYYTSNPYTYGAPNSQPDLRSIFSLNNLSQFIKDKFLAKDFVERENKLGLMEKVCTVEVVNDEIDKLCTLLEKRQREREQSGNYNDSTPLWSDDADNDNADKISSKTHTFLTFLLRFLQDLDNFKRYEVNDFVHY